LPLLRLVGEANVDGFALSVANERERDGFAGALLPKHREQILDRGQGLAGDPDDDVARRDVSSVGRPARRYPVDEDSGCAG
jgi:hypothetical protein